jgi:hypothetical protein
MKQQQHDDGVEKMRPEERPRDKSTSSNKGETIETIRMLLLPSVHIGFRVHRIMVSVARCVL